ncbi:hypothetical protein OPIT5_28000 [Opitutaceae bacterium TAV5]|nr:hypothetical protein OPIT5_28000 [Opitutaceae bacterium TAV5]
MRAGRPRHSGIVLVLFLVLFLRSGFVLLLFLLIVLLIDRSPAPALARRSHDAPQHKKE